MVVKRFFLFNLINQIFFFLKFTSTLYLLLYQFALSAHVKGFYKYQSEAKEKSAELGCEGTFQIKDLWMPCKNEKQLHKFLRKN